MSWSEGRDQAKSSVTKEQVLEKIRQVESVLQKFAKDDDFQDDLKSNDVIRALKHWTGEARLPPEEAQGLQDQRRVVYVLQRLQIFQQVCREAGLVPIPLELLTEGATTVPEFILQRTFGSLFSNLPANSSTEILDKKKIAIDGAAKPNTVQPPQSKIAESKKVDHTSSEHRSRESAESDKPIIESDISNHESESKVQQNQSVIVAIIVILCAILYMYVGRR